MKLCKTAYLSIIFLSLFMCAETIILPSEKNEQMVFCAHEMQDLTVSEIGGKAVNLVRLQKIPGVQVPQFFCVSTDAFVTYLQHNGIYSLICELDNLSSNEENYDAIFKAAQKIQMLIVEGTIPEEIKREIMDSFQQMENYENVVWAVRSSGCSEDSESSSLAGLYDSYLNQRNFEEICLAVKYVWASVFNDRAIVERIRLGYRHTESLIAAVVQQMVNPYVAGIASSFELSTNYPGIEVAANYGTGETVVGGEVATDKWLVHEKQPYIIKSSIGSKSYYAKSTEYSGTQLYETPAALQEKFCLNNDTILEIASQVKGIKEYYAQEIDTEFVVDEAGKIYFVQARPIVEVHASDILVVDAQAIQKAHIIARGLYSVPGVVQGKLRFIKDWQELTQSEVSAEDIILTYRAANAWSHYITQVAGLITKEGSPTSHPILLARERGVPCIIGIDNGFDALINYNGKNVTLDGINRAVYEGLLPLHSADASDLLKAFETVKVIAYPKVDDKIEAFKHANMLFFENEKYWLKTPTYPLKSLEQEINLERFNILPQLIPYHSEVSVAAQIIDDYVCCELVPFESIIHFFDGMTLEQCEEYLENEDDNLRQYLEITNNFSLNSESWKGFIATFTRLRAYVWLGGAFRAYVERLLQEEAARLQVPQHYLDECFSAIQSTLIEEDTLMQQDICNFVVELHDIPISKNLQEMKRSNPIFYRKLKKLGKTYRFSHKISFEEELDLKLVYEKVLSAFEKIQNGYEFYTQKSVCNEKYFPDNSFLSMLVHLTLHNRINQSNAHHYHIRGQWFVQKELLRLGCDLVAKGNLENCSDIFNCTCAEIYSFLNV